MSDSTAFASIAELGRSLRNKDVTAIELAESSLERLERWGAEFNAVVRTTRDLALAQARQADDELRDGRDRGPLHGIPYGLKDLFATKGIPTSWGAAPLKDQMIDDDATVVVRLRESGAILCAKLAMVELAGGFGYKQANASFTGPGRNPWDRTCWSGGSSSGSGAAVAAGLVPFAIGTETMGSIITPAGYCGVTGLRPTYGRVSRHGAMALSWTMDKIGPMCRTAADCALVLHAVAGPDRADETTVPDRWERQPEPKQSGFHFAVLDAPPDDVQLEVLENYNAMLDLLRTIGTVETIKLPDLPYSVVASTIISSEMSAAFESFVRSGDTWELTAPEDRWGAHSNMLIPAKDYINALRIRTKIQHALDDIIAPFDAIVTPTLSTEAGPIEQRFSQWSRGFVCSELSAAANVAGLPGITIPSGFGHRGLPTGIEFTGRAFNEHSILAAAIACQKSSDWHTRHPALKQPTPE
ncbi:amidase [Schlesneria paludicola]|uniref:amidase n=1 Tax=Schlesneria paludicola TaxID=360056 RepID=UPI00029AB0A4|nr:amidase [Schlesneria paludicola]